MFWNDPPPPEFSLGGVPIQPPAPANEVLRRIDHAAIFVVIAATYTPFAANRLASSTGTVLLAAIWSCATEARS